MTFRRSRRPADRAESERLLDGPHAPPTAPGEVGADPLARLLSAATAPARPGELAGEEAALSAFRAARAAGPTTAAARPTRRRRFTAGAVAWGAGIAVTATAGAAFAAATLDRPDDPAPPPRPTTAAPATTGGTRAPETTGSTGGVDPTGTGSRPSTGPSSAPSTDSSTGAPAPSTQDAPRTPEQRTEQLRGLCQAYLARPAAQREKLLDTPAYDVLVTAAGDQANVTDFCRDLVPAAEPDTSPKGRSSPSPAVPGPAATGD